MSSTKKSTTKAAAGKKSAAAAKAAPNHPRWIDMIKVKETFLSQDTLDYVGC